VRRRSSTLIELVTVLAILSLLMALLLPQIVSVRGYARQVPCMSNLHQIGLAFSMYLTDYGSRPVDIADLAVADYVTPEILVCPADVTGNQGGLVCRDASNERPQCWDPTDNIPTSYVYISGRRTDDLWERQEALGSRGSYLICECHGRKRGESCGVPWYEGRVLRLSFDGSVHVGRTHLDHGQIRSLWKDFADEPEPPRQALLAE
jgi:type II secretory pathway pseudopilin PulG